MCERVSRSELMTQMRWEEVEWKETEDTEEVHELVSSRWRPLKFIPQPPSSSQSAGPREVTQ